MISPLQTLAGTYQLRPGARPGVSGLRPVLQAGRLPRLLQNLPQQRIPDVLGSVFTLCAHAHRRTSRQVLGLAALAQDAPAFLLLETVRDHLRSMALDWPQRLPDPPGGAECLGWLKTCPIAIVGTGQVSTEDDAWTALAVLRIWLQEHVLQTNVADWLAQHRDGDALTQWCQRHATRLLPARCLTHWLSNAPATSPGGPLLDVLDADATRQTSQLQALGQCIARRPDFAQYPAWRGQCAENGPWTRLRQRKPGAAPTLAQRLAARWIDLLELVDTSAGTAPGQLLSSGTLSLADGQTLAWCEMARGLLLHWCQRDVNGVIQDYKVIAPTEWNFHPAGILSTTLSALHAGDTGPARALAAAFDPCVACSV